MVKKMNIKYMNTAPKSHAPKVRPINIFIQCCVVSQLEEEISKEEKQV